MENWKTDIQYWERLDRNLINFYLSQAETHLKASIDLSDRITARCVSLLTILIPITVLTVGYILSQSFSPFTNRYLLFIASGGLSALVLILISLTVLVGVREWMSPGGQPKEILTSNMVDTELEPEQQYVAVVLGEIEAIQAKIDVTKQINRRRLNILRFVIWLIVGTFFVVTFFVFRQVAFFIWASTDVRLCLVL